MEMEFDPIIKRAKGRQLNFSLEKIKEFSFLDDEIIDETLPKSTPKALLDRRHTIKAVKNVQKRI